MAYITVKMVHFEIMIFPILLGRRLAAADNTHGEFEADVC